MVSYMNMYPNEGIQVNVLFDISEYFKNFDNDWTNVRWIFKTNSNCTIVGKRQGLHTYFIIIAMCKYISLFVGIPMTLKQAIMK